MKGTLAFIVMCLALGLTSCTNRDPAVYDVRSPCVSYGFDGKDPCVRRKLIENHVA